MQWLLDVNVLVSLALPDHPLHNRAHLWFEANPNRQWATCPITQSGFLRVATFLFGGGRQNLASAVAILDELHMNPNHVFWPLDADITKCEPALKARMLGHNQIADLQLLLLAHRRHAQLATLDNGIVELARGTRYAAAVTLI